MLDLPAEAAKSLPEQTIDGKKVAGFSYEKSTDTPQGKHTLKVSYWIDPDTKRPVRIEKRFVAPATWPKGADGKSPEVVKQAEVSTVISDIVFDAPLDAKLFSTDPPEGYTQRGGKKSEKSNKPKEN